MNKTNVITRTDALAAASDIVNIVKTLTLQSTLMGKSVHKNDNALEICMISPTPSLTL